MKISDVITILNFRIEGIEKVWKMVLENVWESFN